MNDERKTKKVLIDELLTLRRRITRLEKYESEYRKTRRTLKEIEKLQNDVTEGKRMQDALKASEEKYRTLAENAMDAIYIISTDSGFEYVNPAFERLFGYVSVEICHKDFQFLDLVHPDDKNLIENRRKDGEKGKKIPSVYQFKGVTKEGEIKYVEVNTVVFPGDEKKILGILRDISERELKLRESESELRKQKLALEQKDMALREVIAQVETEKKRVEDNVEANVRTLILPILEKLKLENIDSNYFELLRHNLHKLISPFGNKIVKKSLNLTPKEIEICNMLKAGLASKEISQLLHVSPQTIIKHRKNIRLKLGISSKRVNLVSYLHEL